MYCDFIKDIGGLFHLCAGDDYKTKDNYSLIYWLGGQDNLNTRKLRCDFSLTPDLPMLFFNTSGILLLTGVRQMMEE